MKEHPILFSTDMVIAKLEGTKTKTRRIINPQPIIDQDSGFVFDGKHRKQYDIHNWKDRFIDDYSRWMPGDLLWTRETWRWIEGDLGSGAYDFKADNNDFGNIKWKPSIFMPKEAARIWDEILSIKVERLHEITEEDAIAEGIERSISGNGRIVWKHYTKDKYGPSPVHSYETLWRKINGEESWNENPFVWVIQFKVLSTTGKPS